LTAARAEERDARSATGVHLPYAGAFGWDGGLGTSWLVDPGRDLTVIVLTRRLFEGAVAPDVHRDLQAAALAALA
jgi:CubicO group peptidase (beta-lactamase class C family)